MTLSRGDKPRPQKQACCKSAFVHVFARPLTRLEAVSARQDEATPDLSSAHSQAEPTGHLLPRMKKTAARAPGVPEADIDALIDEAVDHVRHHDHSNLTGSSPPLQASGPRYRCERAASRYGAGLQGSTVRPPVEGYGAVPRRP